MSDQMGADSFYNVWQNLRRISLVHLKVVIDAFYANIPDIHAVRLELADKILDLRA